MSWGPLQEAVSEGLLTTSEMQEAFGLVQRRDEGDGDGGDKKDIEQDSKKDKGVEQDKCVSEEAAQLGLAAFVELALLLQQAIDRAIAAQTGEGRERYTRMFVFSPVLITCFLVASGAQSAQDGAGHRSVSSLYTWRSAYPLAPCCGA